MRRERHQGVGGAAADTPRPPRVPTPRASHPTLSPGVAWRAWQGGVGERKNAASVDEASFFIFAHKKHSHTAPFFSFTFPPPSPLPHQPHTHGECARHRLAGAGDGRRAAGSAAGPCARASIQRSAGRREGVPSRARTRHPARRAPPTPPPSARLGAGGLRAWHQGCVRGHAPRGAAGGGGHSHTHRRLNAFPLPSSSPWPTPSAPPNRPTPTAGPALCARTRR